MTGTFLRASPLDSFKSGFSSLPHSDSAQVFVTNHDLEREDKALRWNASGSRYWLAHVFLLTWPYGRPDVLSGFSYKSFDDGPKAGRVDCGRCVEMLCCESLSSPLIRGMTRTRRNGWRCEHRHPAMLGSIALRRAAGRAPVQYIMTVRYLSHQKRSKSSGFGMQDGKHRLSYSRGRKAFVAINNDYRSWKAHFATGLPAGVYCK